MPVPASYFVWLPLPEDARADRIAATLARHQISVSTAEPFATTAHSPQAVRLALGSADLYSLSTTLHTVAHVVSLDAAQ
jgi:DNA-binding transcriptional MocR family regulator